MADRDPHSIEAIRARVAFFQAAELAHRARAAGQAGRVAQIRLARAEAKARLAALEVHRMRFPLPTVLR